MNCVVDESNGNEKKIYIKVMIRWMIKYAMNIKILIEN